MVKIACVDLKMIKLKDFISTNKLVERDTQKFKLQTIRKNIKMCIEFCVISQTKRISLTNIYNIILNISSLIFKIIKNIL